MSFYKLERTEYKKVSQEFRKTYIGGRLYLIFIILAELLLLSIIIWFGEGFLAGLKGIGPPEFLLTNIEDDLLIISVFVSYYLYFINLKKFFEENKLKNKEK